MKECPYCSKENVDNAIYCSYCRQSLLPKEPKPKALLVILGILFLLLVSVSYFLYSFYNKDLQNIESLLEKDVVIATMEKERIDNELTISILESKRLTLLSTKQAVEASLREQKNLSATLQADKAALDQLNKEKTKRLRELSKNLCSEPSFKPDYTNNTTMSWALWKFVETRFGTVIDTEQEALWSNSNDSIHTIITLDEYRRSGHLFLVFFGDSGNKESVFWINKGCWLSR